MSRSRSLPSSRPSNTGGAEDAPIISSDARPVSGVTGIGRRGRELSFRFAPLSLMQLRVSQQQSVGSQAQLWSPSHSRIHLDVVKAQIARLSLTLRVRAVLHDSHVGNTIAFLITSGTCHQVHSLASLRPCGYKRADIDFVLDDISFESISGSFIPDRVLTVFSSSTT